MGAAMPRSRLGATSRDLEDIALRQRVLTAVSTLDLSTTLFGRTQRLPVALAPIGLAGMNARRGEVLRSEG
jgi:L-lactate dehydrogenase (cytochrome)